MQATNEALIFRGKSRQRYRSERQALDFLDETVRLPSVRRQRARDRIRSSRRPLLEARKIAREIFIGGGPDTRIDFSDVQELRVKLLRRDLTLCPEQENWLNRLDEAILPSRTLTLNRDSLFGLLKTLRPVKPELADVLEDFAVSLRTFDGERINMPDIDREGIDLEEFVNHFTSPDHKADAEQLWYLSGRVVRVRREGPKGPTTLDYEDILPADLAPMLILDASGGLRKTYDFWSKHRGELKTLYSPPKSYSGLTIHHFDRAAGKSKHHHWKDVKELASDVVKMIAEIPDHEAVLVVHHKAKPKNPDIVSAIREGLPDRLGEVRFVNWGRHTATNEFADIKNVILAGILQYNLAQYEATGRAAKRATVEDEFSEDDFRATRIGEISHHIFQAAGRGAIRKTENGGCPQGCDLYTVFSTHKVTGFPKEQLLTIFPDADLVDWSPDGQKVEKRLTGNLRKTVETIKSAIDLGGRITTAEVREIVGMDRRNFNSLIAGDVFKQATSAIPYAREKGKAGVWG